MLVILSFSVSWEKNGNCGAEKRDTHMEWDSESHREVG